LILIDFSSSILILESYMNIVASSFLMEQRKIMSLGSSLAVTLPKEWVKENCLKKGESVTMTVQRDNNLLLSPAEDFNLKPTKELHLLIGFNEDEESIVRKIIAGFLNGYSLIKLTSNRYFTSHQQVTIRDITSKLYMMILEAESSSITLQMLLDESKASVVSSIERMHVINYSMCKDILGSFHDMDKELLQVIYSLEKEVDRLMFLLLRMIRMAAVNPFLAKQISLDPIDCLDYQTLVHRIERIGDHLAQFSKSMISILDLEISVPTEVYSTIQEAAEIAFTTYDMAVRAYMAKDVSKADEIIDNQQKIVDLYKKITPIPYFGKHNNLTALSQIITMRECVKKISHYSADIAELTIGRAYK